MELWGENLGQNCFSRKAFFYGRRFLVCACHVLEIVSQFSIELTAQRLCDDN